MDSILRYEKKLYFPTRKDYWVSRVTREDNYLIWKYQYYLRKEENAGNKLLVYWYRRRKNPGCSGEYPGLPYLKEATFFRTRARCNRASARRRSVSEAFWS